MKILALIFAILPIYFDVSDGRCDCPYKYKRVGCFKDRRGDEALPELLATERDKHSEYYNKHDINWSDWDNYMPQLVCRCAEQALKKGYKYFGIEFWGECWSGPSPAADSGYKKHGEGAKCHGPGYRACHENDVDCVGAKSHNFIYEIESYKCDVHFEKIGCYNDYTSRRYPSLKTLALTARDPSSEKYMGQNVDWWNYDIFLPQFACECAKKIIEANYTTFGLQYYGECWAGSIFEEKKYIQQGETSRCVNSCYRTCKLWDRFCIGRGFANTVYRITRPECEIKYESLGCYKAVDHGDSLAMPELLHNELSPSIDKFNGYVLHFDENWETMYPQLLCRCARVAEEKGYQNFAIRNRGECWSGPNSGRSYNQYGQSSECIRKINDPCQDNILCAGGVNSINVYKILGNSIRTGT